MDRLLEDDGKVGAENVLDTADATDSWESWSSVWLLVVIMGGWVAVACSEGAIDK